MAATLSAPAGVNLKDRSHNRTDRYRSQNLPARLRRIGPARDGVADLRPDRNPYVAAGKLHDRSLLPTLTAVINEYAAGAAPKA